jgi:hypothetical protein
MCGHLLIVQKDGDAYRAIMWYRGATGPTEMDALWSLHAVLTEGEPDATPLFSYWPRGSGAATRLNSFLAGS